MGAAAEVVSLARHPYDEEVMRIVAAVMGILAEADRRLSCPSTRSSEKRTLGVLG